MTDIQLFDVGDQPWRFGVTDDGHPYAVAADVAGTFEYRDAANALRLLDDDEKGTQIVSTPGGDQRLSVVYEDGIWELIFRSTKPEARTIKKQVKEILRTIRETGGYGTTPQRELSRKEMARYWYEAEDRAEAAEQRAAELEPDAEYTRRTVDADGLRLVGQVAKAWGMQEKQLREYLYAEGLLIRGGARRNDPTAYATDRQWLVSKSRLADGRKVWTTYVTPRGEVGIWRRRYTQGLETRPQPPSTQLALVDGSA
ncbi:prophage antirepressor-like protein [Lipingzhangella halophila]|uniref:Prophage antirepressor-like protein n=1 Tax=Lipingzhangella halophila TaxID=1783352 RepID=A0A7W7RQC1_9ACTN|nr:phage antirepressor KilAC domain-containing protein [Lipingzhangella halophila]MBB4935693.1 prophage antirepressor-like protein [Lipingzhangella halophila]